MLDPKVFKAYDVRGIHPTELDEDGAYRVGRAFVEHFGLGRIAVGRDMRVSAPTMTAAVIDGAADGGADVLDLGMIGTEMLYYAVGELDLARERAEIRVIPKEMGHRLRVAEVVQRDDLDIGAQLLLRAEEVAADPAEAVDAYSNGHGMLLASRGLR